MSPAEVEVDQFAGRVIPPRLPHRRISCDVADKLPRGRLRSRRDGREKRSNDHAPAHPVRVRGQQPPLPLPPQLRGKPRLEAGVLGRTSQSKVLVAPPVFTVSGPLQLGTYGPRQFALHVRVGLRRFRHGRESRPGPPAF